MLWKLKKKKKLKKSSNIEKKKLKRYFNFFLTFFYNASKICMIFIFIYLRIFDVQEVFFNYLDLKLVKLFVFDRKMKTFNWKKLTKSWWILSIAWSKFKLRMKSKFESFFYTFLNFSCLKLVLFLFAFNLFFNWFNWFFYYAYFADTSKNFKRNAEL